MAEFAASAFAREALGAEVHASFTELKRAEWLEYNTVVSEWEREQVPAALVTGRRQPTLPWSSHPDRRNSREQQHPIADQAQHPSKVRQPRTRSPTNASRRQSPSWSTSSQRSLWSRA